MNPSGLNDSAREMMAALKRDWNHKGPTLTSAGTANAQTLTYTATPTAYVQGDVYTFIVGASNTGAATLNVNGLGAKNIFANGAALLGFELKLNSICTLMYDGTQFNIVARSILPTVTAPNLLVNSAMDFDQAREGAALGVSSGTTNYVADMWPAQYHSASATCTVQRVTDAPVGFSKSIKLTIGTGAAVAAGDYLFFQQNLEANNITQIAFGVASAQTLSLSFWVKSSIGSYTMSGALINTGATRSYPFNITINSSNTWEQKFITIPGDTTGSWVLNGNGVGLTLILSAASGLTFQGTANTWATGFTHGTASNTNTLLSTNGSTFQLTGVKLEISPLPTPYVRRSYDQELAMCQRYYEKSNDPGTVPGTASNFSGCFFLLVDGSTNLQEAGQNQTYKVTKRTTATVTLFSPQTGASGKIFDHQGNTDVTGTANIPGMNCFSWFGLGIAPAIAVELSGQWTADARL